MLARMYPGARTPGSGCPLTQVWILLVLHAETPAACGTCLTLRAVLLTGANPAHAVYANDQRGLQNFG